MAARVILIIGGGIAAYRTLDVIRILRRRGIDVTCVMTEAASHFVTPLSVQALSGEAVHRDLLSLAEDSSMDHIALSRSADLLVLCPASANLLARMAHGLADDLATTLLLATDKPVLAAPAMNVRMWENPATQRNLSLLRAQGCHFVGPDEGEMACGEFGPGRLSTPDAIVDAIEARLPRSFARSGQASASQIHAGQARAGQALAGQAPAERVPARQPLSGRSVLVTAGPTQEPIDPVRFIANRSSGRQGYAIAAACAALGAEVTLVSGPTNLPCPEGVRRIDVTTACDMDAACKAALPVDAAICTAAVGDWRVAEPALQKRKKPHEKPRTGTAAQPASSLTLTLVENPDILASLSRPGPDRPALVVGFAAETEALESHAREKRQRKGCDWLLANDVGAGSSVFGGDRNTILFLTATETTLWPELPKATIGRALADRIAAFFSGHIARTRHSASPTAADPETDPATDPAIDPAPASPGDQSPAGTAETR
ncbi:bifunctional phosphopantothenoylcysteine decarboxylase/phosphopantothenate synthase [Swaminathania salitolerans]|uniref:Coenzyme A biosynthesis bifunctional protein CoaBC n=1 Tax=Swaminathania salitolerans TaxID=182838 RepID=A0A511BP79_9PROT|nr:bifunctional phosphopantothenoylcysteine decarboxylase/phosphopantothenate synthase [Swaminathania salitolerans]GBQ15347.1 phosphopantothenoylcysteine synthase [Swaminathania salitolerans LMG 21291]GEL02075.1 phosphopantothenate synthase [Swaminathania salitolerans]